MLKIGKAQAIVEQRMTISITISRTVEDHYLQGNRGAAPTTSVAYCVVCLLSLVARSKKQDRRPYLLPMCFLYLSLRVLIRETPTVISETVVDFCGTAATLLSRSHFGGLFPYFTGRGQNNYLTMAVGSNLFSRKPDAG